MTKSGIKHIFSKLASSHPATFLFLALALLLYLYLSKSCTSHKCLVFADKENWQLNKTIIDNKKSWKGLFDYDGYLVRLEVVGGVNREIAKHNSQTKLIQLTGLFDSAPSAYPGLISDEIFCPEKFDPIVEKFVSGNELDTVYVQAKISDKLQYGSCLDNEANKDSHLIMFFCDNSKQWYSLEFIVEKSNNSEKFKRELRKKIEKIECKSPAVYKLSELAHYIND